MLSSRFHDRHESRAEPPALARRASGADAFPSPAKLLISYHMKYLGPPQTGSLANQTYSRNPYGQYVRNRVMPSQVATPGRTTSIAIWQAANDCWQSMTDAQRSAWIDLARQTQVATKLGVQSRLTGQALFMRSVVQSWRFNSHHFPTSIPPLADLPAWSDPLPVSVAVSGADALVTWAAAVSQPWLVNSCGPCSAGTMSLPGKRWWVINGVVAPGAVTHLVPLGASAGEVWGIRLRQFSAPLGGVVQTSGFLQSGLVYRLVF